MITKQQQRYIKENAFKKSNRKIARELKISEKTIRNYKKKIFGYSVNKYKDFDRIKKSMKPIELEREEWAYISGLIDGEGTITIFRRKGKKYEELTPIFSLSSIDKEIIYWLKEKLKCGTISLSKNKRENQRDTYIIRKSGFGILPILNGISPYTIIKKKNTILIKKFIKIRLNQKWKETYSKELFNIHSKIQKINKRGIK